MSRDILRRWITTLMVAVVAALVAAVSPAWAQQDTQNRLWQGIEQQQSQQRSAPAPLKEEAGNSAAPGSALAGLLQAPQERLQQQQLSILNAVNQRDWFGADRLLRQYERMPQFSPVLSRFVEASRAGAAGDLNAALVGYEQVLEADPRFTRATLDMARLLYADNRVADAQEVFDRLRTQPLPPQVLRHIDEYQLAIQRRDEFQWSLSLSAVHEDNVNSTSTVVDPCALVFMETCFANTPGEKQAATGVYFEGSLNKLWSLRGHHGLLLRGISYGNHYWGHESYDSLATLLYAGYQYATARHQLQLLPLFEIDVEGGREIYRAFGLRASASRQLTERAQVEASVEYKARHFTPRLAESLAGDFRSATLFGQYALNRGWVLYGHLMWRETDARQPVFAYREKVARLGVHKTLANRATVNVAYGWRQKAADAANTLFGRRQRDIEDSLYVNVAMPVSEWKRIVPSVTYEYRNNRSSIPHAYSYEKNRLAVGFNAVF